MSRTATEWPSALSEMARPEPTRPHPTTITCTPQCNTPGRGHCKRLGPGRGGDFLLLCGRGDAAERRSRSPGRRPRRARGRRRGDPRDPPLPAQEQVARAAAGHRAAGHRAPEPPDRVGRAGPRLHLVIGLRHRGDADPAGAVRRFGRLRFGGSHHAGHLGRPLLRHPLLPRGHSALHQGRRLLRGGARQLRSQGRPDRRRGPPDRLHGDRRRAVVGRHGGAHERRAEPRQHDRHRRHHRGRRPAPPVRQPARNSRGRQLFRHPHLLLRLLAGVGDHRWLRQGGARPAAPDPAATAERALRREDRHAGQRDG